MNTLATRPPGRWMLAALALCVLLTGAGITACGPSAPTPTRKPTTAPTVAPTAAVTAAPTAPPEGVHGTTVALAPGGTVFVPEGALPQGAQLSASRTQIPALPDDVVAVGDAVSIAATAQPSQPVTLRLPVPPGVADPAELVILRIEPNGATTFLMTRVEQDELVAETPGFSTFVAVRVPSDLPVVLIGKEQLLPGEQHTYLVRRAKKEWHATAYTWAVSGMATLVYQSEFAATIQAGHEPARAALIYSCSDGSTGRRWFGSIRIRVVDPAIAPDSFAVSVVARPPVAYVGKDPVRIVAAVHGNYQAPITWTWEFENGQKGGPVPAGVGATEFELPASTYPPQDQAGIHAVTVWASDTQGRRFAGYGEYETKVEPFRVTVDGSQRLTWSDPGAYETYTASASGGEPPYAYSFQLFPGSAGPREGGGPGSNSATFRFEQSGEYRLEVSAQDNRKRTIKTSVAIVAQGGERLSTRILVLPATASPDQKVTAFISIRGGVLVTGGSKRGYRLRVDWGDGSAPVVEQNVGATTTPYSGTIVSLLHQFPTAGKRTVRVEAYDVSGSMDWYEQDIVITAAGTPTRAATATKAAPTATPAGGLLVWVRQEPAVVNANKDPLEGPAPEPRWAGSFSRISVSGTSFTTQEKYVDHEMEYYSVSITCNFDTPPLVLNPGLRYKVTVNCSHGGTNPGGEQGLGEQFWYSAQRGYENIIEPREVLKYYPWSTAPGGTSSKEWMVAAPPAGRLGDTFQIYAGLWNRAPCNVTWTYRMEYH